MDVISYTLSKKYTDEKCKDMEDKRQQDKLKVTKVEKELNDFKGVINQVNINQEPRQSVSGYGTISLPKNAANGQVSVSVKGNTETDEEGNTKSTIAAMKIKSVGKNLFNGKLEVGYIDPITGLNSINTTRSRTVDYINVTQSTQYIISSITNLNDFRIMFYDVNKNFIDTITYTTTSYERLFVTPVNCRYLKFTNAATNDTTIKYQIEKKSALLATSYEPYKEDISYVIAKDKDNKIVNLRSLPNGTKDEIRVSEGKLIKRLGIYTFKETDIETVSNNEDQLYANAVTKTLPLENVPKWTVSPIAGTSVPGWTEKRGYSWFRDVPEGYENSYWTRDPHGIIFCFPKGTTLEQAQEQLSGLTLTYQLAEPEIIPIQVSGNIVSNPSGTIYIEPAVADANVYNDGISIFEQELNIDYIDKIAKVDYTTGIKTPLDVSQAVISEDRKSFTHPDLVNGDMVFFEYYYSNETTQGEATVEYYDSRYVIPDKTLPDKYYKWDIEVDNGVPNVIVTEV